MLCLRHLKRPLSVSATAKNCKHSNPVGVVLHLQSRMSAKGGPQSIGIMRIAECDQVRQISSLFRGLGGSSARRRSRPGHEWGRRASAEYVRGQETIAAVSPWKKWCCFVFGVWVVTCLNFAVMKCVLILLAVSTCAEAAVSPLAESAWCKKRMVFFLFSQTVCYGAGGEEPVIFQCVEVCSMLYWITRFSTD